MKYYISKEHGFEFVLTESIAKHFPKHNHVANYVVGLVLGGEVFLEKGQGRECYTRDAHFCIPPYQVHEMDLTAESKLLSLCVGVAFLERYPLWDCISILEETLSILEQRYIITGEHRRVFVAELKNIYSMHGSMSEPSDLTAIIQELAGAPEENILLEQLAQRAYVSKYHLVRRFKQETGLTPHCFQLQNRIRKAQKLLPIAGNGT